MQNKKKFALAVAAAAAVSTSIWSQRRPRESRGSSGSAPPSEEENTYFTCKKCCNAIMWTCTTKNVCVKTVSLVILGAKFLPTFANIQMFTFVPDSSKFFLTLCIVCFMKSSRFLMCPSCVMILPGSFF